MGQIVNVYPDLPDHTQPVTLGGTRYQLRLVWLHRSAAWYADLRTQAGDPIWLGQRVSPGHALGIGLQADGAPPGLLLVRGQSGYDRQDLGDTVQIVYYPPGELPAASTSSADVTVTV